MRNIGGGCLHYFRIFYLKHLKKGEMGEHVLRIIKYKAKDQRDLSPRPNPVTHMAETHLIQLVTLSTTC